jgi:hypothetical protein
LQNLVFGTHRKQLLWFEVIRHPTAEWLARQIEPRFDAEITYADVTDDGMVRHLSFKRLVT